MSRRLALAAVLLVGAFPSLRSQAADPPSLPYLFPASAGRGQELEVTAGGSFKDWPVQVHVEGAGLTVEPAEEKGKFHVKVAADATPGLRLIRLHNAAGASELKPFHVGILNEIVEQEPNDEPGKPRKLDALPAAIAGRLAKRGDVDTYAIQLTTGQTLVAALAAQALGSPMDGVLQVVTPQGHVLDQIDDAPDLDPIAVFQAPADGTYLVRVFAFPATPDSSINLAGGDAYIYRLTLTTGGYLQSVLPLALERCQEESTSDLQPIGVNLTDGPSALKIDPSFRPGHAVAWCEQWPGEVELPVIDLPSLREVPPASGASAQALSVPASLSGRLEQPGEEDAFALELAQNQEVEIRVEARALSSPLDPVIRVEDADGKVLAEQDDLGRDSRDVELRFKAQAEARYRVVIADLFGQGGPLFVYRLAVSEPAPRFELELKADRVTLGSKEPAKLAVSIRRQNGFDQPIDLALTGLPEGVKASPARSEPKGDSSKSVTFELGLDSETEASPFSGPVQVVGRVGDQEQKAVFPTTFARISLDAAWLTVVPAQAKD